MDTCNFLKTPRFQHLFLQKDNIFRFLILQVFLIFGLSNYSFAQTTLTAQSAIGSASTSSSTFSTVTRASVTIDVTSINYILVVATFQVEMTSPDGHGREASFRIADNASQETINSGTIKRSLANAKSTDYGIGSVVYIFDVSELSNNRTYVLQHAFSTVARTLTTNGTIVAVALKGGSEHLKNDVKRVSSPVTMGTEWAAVSGSETSVITTTVTGGFYVAASIESKTSSFTTSSVAEWKLQYKKGALGSWTDLCTSVERSMSNTSDRGIINLVGTLPDGSTSGDYYFQIAHRRTSPSSTINTETCNITAVSLGITAGNFPVFMEMATGVSTASSSLVNAVTASMTPSANTSLFIHAQYGITGTEATNSTYDIYVDDGSEFFNGADQLRYLSGSTAKGSGASVGLTSSLTASTLYNVSLRHATSVGTLTSNDLSLNGFGLTLDSGPLPVELLYFNAENYRNSEVSLNWATASEINNEYFVVERSKDAVNWEEVEKVTGAGNSNNQINYSIVDEEPYSGISYYRLKQIDFNGESKEFEIISVNLNNNSTSINLYPNPVINQLIIENVGSNKNDEFEIFNSTGQIVSKGSLLEMTIVPTSNFSSGIYLVKIKSGDSFEFRKIVKE